MLHFPLGSSPKYTDISIKMSLPVTQNHLLSASPDFRTLLVSKPCLGYLIEIVEKEK